MATAAPQLDTLIELFECPVCTESYEDPYIIKCGHHFCRKCLEGIANEHPQGSVRCPTCRKVTDFTQGSKVTDLPRPVLMNQVQEKISSFLGKAKRKRLVVYCDACVDQKVTAASHCYQCQANFCQQCRTKHSPLEKQSHRVVPIADSMFCTTHPKQVVLSFCENCDHVICTLCLIASHSAHKIDKIATKAEGSRSHLEEFVQSKSSIGHEDKFLSEIKDKHKKAKSLITDLDDLVSRLKGLLKELDVKLEQVERDTRTKLMTQVKMLAIREEETRNLMVSRQSLIDHAIYLTQKASDQELIEQAKTFPTSAKLAVSTEIQDKSTELPVLDNLQKLCSNLQQMITDCKVDFRTEKLTSTTVMDIKKPQTIQPKLIKDIKKQQTIKVGHTFSGITMDVQRHRLVVRTNDKTGPLKVYDYQGQLQESLGAGVAGLGGGIHRGICVDTKRDCYVAPGPSSLLVVDRAGHLIKAVSVGGQCNCGVAYGEHNDIYVVSEWGQNIVYLIDPHTSQVTRQFGSPGSGPSQFNGPFNVHVGNMAAIKKPVIVVSDYYNHCVKVFDTSGQYIKTHGSQGSGDNQLSAPWSVCTDHNGSLLVSDGENKRVMMISRDDSGQDHWERLLNNDWDGVGPWNLTLDTSDMVLAVANNNGDTLYIYS